MNANRLILLLNVFRGTPEVERDRGNYEMDLDHLQTEGLIEWLNSSWAITGKGLQIVDRLRCTPSFAAPVPIRLPCPECGTLHVDEGEWAKKPHHTHACQGCGNVWRPAVEHTVGIQFLPGFKN